ncbi:MAG TPA: metalloregulator ArsR/SmtB family transcription factor [Ktedonobacterales bacterium]
MDTPAWSASGERGVPLVDEAPVFDGLVSLSVVAQPRYLRSADWRVWAETTASELRVEHWRLARKWFAEVAIGAALVALAPLLRRTRDLDELAATVEALPLADLARIAATADMIAPQAPLDAADLLALRGDLAAARRFCDRYLRETARRRAAIARALADPEGMRDELVALLRMHSTHVFAALDARLRDERQRGATALRAQIQRDGGVAPTYVRGKDDLRGFSPVVIGVSTLLGDGRSYYYHDIDRALIDSPGAVAYEPFIAVVGARRALGLTRRRSAALPDSGERFADPVERWAALYAALGDASRLRIVRLLAERPRYGQELAAELGMSAATVSHHLAALEKAGALSMERRAHRTYFTLDARALRMLLRAGERFALGEAGSSGAAAADAREEGA